MKDSPQGKATRNLSKQVPLGSFFSNTHSFVCLALLTFLSNRLPDAIDMQKVSQRSDWG